MTNLIQNCSFISNEARSHGGAIHLINPFNLLIENCTFSNNSASYGGSIYYQEACIFYNKI